MMDNKDRLGAATRTFARGTMKPCAATATCKTRSSAIAQKPRDTLFQLKSSKLLHNYEKSHSVILDDRDYCYSMLPISILLVSYNSVYCTDSVFYVTAENVLSDPHLHS